MSEDHLIDTYQTLAELCYIFMQKYREKQAHADEQLIDEFRLYGAGIASGYLGAMNHLTQIMNDIEQGKSYTQKEFHDILWNVE